MSTQNNKSEYIPIVFCFDKAYIDPALVSTYSVFFNSKTKIKFYWICYESNLAHAQFYQKYILKLGINLEIIHVDDDIFNTWKTDLIVPHVTKAAYLRILIPNLVKETRIIYLDCDTITLSDLNELYNVNLNDYSIAGVDNFLSHVDVKVYPPIIDSSFTYINSGVMVMDLDKLRKHNFYYKVKEIHDKYYELVMAGDQCLINKFLENNKILLDRKWNYMIKNTRISDKEFEEIIKNEDIKIIHFTDSSKPWNMLTYGSTMANFWFQFSHSLKNNLKFIGSEVY
jgi:lipopolysaccharide biosynthesis glycosyltransferase